MDFGTVFKEVNESYNFLTTHKPDLNPKMAFICAVEDALYIIRGRSKLYKSEGLFDIDEEEMRYLDFLIKVACKDRELIEFLPKRERK